MQVVLKVLNGSSANRMAVLRHGQVLKVGRTSWADLTIADDPDLADVHFQLECQGSACQLRKLAGDGSLSQNGEDVQEASVFDGDEITAGNTKFHVSVEGGALSAADEDAPAAPKGSGYPHVEALLASEIAEKCEFENDATALLQDGDNSREFIERLIENERAADAIEFLAHALPKREAVWWACSVFPPGEEAFDQTAYAAAKAWVLDPSEENRKAAETVANAHNVVTPQIYIAMAVSFSGGSLAPPDQEPIPPADHLTAFTIALTIKTSAILEDPGDAETSLRKSLDVGLQVAEGDNRWE